MYHEKIKQGLDILRSPDHEKIFEKEDIGELKELSIDDFLKEIINTPEFSYVHDIANVMLNKSSDSVKLLAEKLMKESEGDIRGNVRSYASSGGSILWWDPRLSPIIKMLTLVVVGSDIKIFVDRKFKNKEFMMFAWLIYMTIYLKALINTMKNMIRYNYYRKNGEYVKEFDMDDGSTHEIKIDLSEHFNMEFKKNIGMFFFLLFAGHVPLHFIDKDKSKGFFEKFNENESWQALMTTTSIFLALFWDEISDPKDPYEPTESDKLYAEMMIDKKFSEINDTNSKSEISDEQKKFNENVGIDGGYSIDADNFSCVVMVLIIIFIIIVLYIINKEYGGSINVVEYHKEIAGIILLIAPIAFVLYNINKEYGGSTF